MAASSRSSPWHPPGGFACALLASSARRACSLSSAARSTLCLSSSARRLASASCLIAAAARASVSIRSASALSSSSWRLRCSSSSADTLCACGSSTSMASGFFSLSTNGASAAGANRVGKVVNRVGLLEVGVGAYLARLASRSPVGRRLCGPALLLPGVGLPLLYAVGRCILGVLGGLLVPLGWPGRLGRVWLAWAWMRCQTPQTRSSWMPAWARWVPWGYLVQYFAALSGLVLVLRGESFSRDETDFCSVEVWLS